MQQHGGDEVPERGRDAPQQPRKRPAVNLDVDNVLDADGNRSILGHLERGKLSPIPAASGSAFSGWAVVRKDGAASKRAKTSDKVPSTGDCTPCHISNCHIRAALLHAEFWGDRHGILGSMPVRFLMTSGAGRDRLGSHLSNMQGIERSDLQFANSLKLLSDAAKEAEAHQKKSATSINVDMLSLCFSGKHRSVAVATFWEDILCSISNRSSGTRQEGSAGSALNARLSIA